MTVPPNHEVEPNNKIISYWLIMIFVFLKMSFKAFVLHVCLYLFNTKQNICNHICFTLSDLFNSRVVAHKDKSRCVITHVTPRFPTDLANSPLWSILTDLTRKDRWLNSIVSCCPIDKFLASLGWSNQWNDSFSAPTVIQKKLQALPPSAHPEVEFVHPVSAGGSVKFLPTV